MCCPLQTSICLQIPPWKAQNQRLAAGETFSRAPLQCELRNHSLPGLPVIGACWHCLHEVKSSSPCFPVPLLGRQRAEDTVISQLFLEKILQLLVGATIKGLNEKHTHSSCLAAEKEDREIFYLRTTFLFYYSVKENCIGKSRNTLQGPPEPPLLTRHEIPPVTLES